MSIARKNPELSRRAILEAAAAEFANEGIAGARIDAIAAAAGVNKALLYYYFQDKETLYGAVLEQTFQGLLEDLVRILDTDRSAGYKVLAYALTHFNHVAAHPHYRGGGPTSASSDVRHVKGSWSGAGATPTPGHTARPVPPACRMT